MYSVPLVDRSMKGYDIQAKKYLEYINEHRKNVEIAFRNLFFNPVRNLGESKIFELNFPWEKYINRLEEEIKNHDMSKYSDEEFYAYRAKFNQTEEEKYKYDNDEEYQKMVDEAFDIGWDHHFRFNYHHPKFWKFVEILSMDGFGIPLQVNYNFGSENKEIRDMTPIAICHMICDWEAMSIKFSGSTVDWYINKADQERRDMSENTRKLVKQIMEYLYDVELPDSVL